ncbi:Indoleamine 2,3-dioxygenase [Penicillium griseofulvum]|uniref:Indoleamine 2,3-dioxygenase n=1 Tax=Penicillium patulum TaxID=5078 RepID=A0A135LG25_PENPA|nr:Indoleamine 2,3-dioxygenase [Penicillium griseofulvum]KXG47903.1 Indoleamine 2,3-dioxygenase [Penicillium griseofulvum]
MLQSTDAIFNDLFGSYAEQGFLPDRLPLARLPNPYYKTWEDIASQLPSLIQSSQIRDRIDNMPVCTTEHLQTEAEWRRACVIMGYFTHAYIWGGEIPKDRLPPSISKPFLEISAHLQLPACATYAGLTLWNFLPSSPGADITDPDNLHVQTSFTGTKDEEWFMVISVAVEAKGIKLLALMRDAFKAVVAIDVELLTALLYRFADGLSDLTMTLKRMYEHNEPDVFYHQLRPFLAGSKNMGHAGLPNGVFYDVGDEVERPENWLQLSGGSNAQSSLIQALDIFLGIKHSATDGKQSGGPSFIQQMRDYMPGPHRRFLEELSVRSNVRPFVLDSSVQSLKDAYNAAVKELKGFRDAHIQMVTRYIVMASRKPNPVEQAKGRINLATASSQTEETGAKTKLAGTGGTDLIPFLKKTRDTVQDAKC